MRDFLTTQEVGEQLGVGPRQVANLVRAGRLPYVRHGQKLRFPRHAWDEWLASQSREALAVVEDARHAD